MTEQGLENTEQAVKTWYAKFIGSADPADVAWFFFKTLLLLVVCLVVKRVLLAALSKVLERTRIEKGLQNFLKYMVNFLLWLITIIIVAGSLGISMTPLIAAFSVIGLALSLSVQDSLSNLAGGINILASRAFVVGDYIEIGEDGGVVHDIGMVHTSLTTFDNRRIMVPNSKVMSARVINYSTELNRRVDLHFTASYDAPIEKVKSVVEQMVKEHPKTLQEPAPIVRVTKYDDSAIAYVIRVWSLRDDYWDVYYDLLEQIKPTLDANDISIPYPHMNVHIMEEKP
jgi:small conductance mechanosensitive channel